MYLRRIFKRAGVVTGAIVASLTANAVQGGVFIDFAPATFAEGSGVQEVIILARSDADDRVGGISLEFGLPDGGVFSFVSQQDFINDNIDPNTLLNVSSGQFYTRYFNESGYLGFGGIDKTGSFLVIDPAPDPTIGFLSLDFTPDLQFGSSFQPLGKLRIDVTGLAQSTYTIQVRDGSAFGSAVINVSGTNGSFDIVAVPESSAILFVAIASVTIAVGHHMRKRPAIDPLQA